MSDEVLCGDGPDSTARFMSLGRWALPSNNRRWVIRYALAMTATVNLVVNSSLAWLTTINHSHLKLLTVPLIQAPSMITNTLGTFVILPFTTSVLCSLSVRGFRGRGLLDPVIVPRIGPWRWLSCLPSGDVSSGFVLAGWTAVLLGPATCAVLVGLASNGVSRSSFVIYNAILGVALGAVITPLVAVKAMADTAGSDTPAPT